MTADRIGAVPVKHITCTSLDECALAQQRPLLNLTRFSALKKKATSQNNRILDRDC